MLIKVRSLAFRGLESIPVDVEINISKKALPGFSIVGLPDKSINESKERIITALKNSFSSIPNYKIIVNLAPADIPKEGSLYDLPIALGIYSAIHEQRLPQQSLFVGELSLDGRLREINGALLASIFCKEEGYRNLFLPKQNAEEAAIIESNRIYALERLEDITKAFSNDLEDLRYKKESTELPKFKSINHLKDPRPSADDLSEEKQFRNIIGQEQGKRALKIIAGGGHSGILIGPPGSGKSMMARSIKAILPKLSQQEAFEVTKILSLTGKLPKDKSLVTDRQFRSPHHTTSPVGLIGGGRVPMPGDITLAHRGVLFMDEFSEFPRSVLEALRQPLEDGEVNISRSIGRITYPSRFTLIAASNPCPCGHLGDPNRQCRCSESRLKSYQKKFSGPIMDRIDIQLFVKPVELNKLKDSQDSKTDIQKAKSTSNSDSNISDLREQIEITREIQIERYTEESILTNAELESKMTRKYCKLTHDAKKVLDQATLKFKFSARSYFKLIKIARTLADMEKAEELIIENRSKSRTGKAFDKKTLNSKIRKQHIAEAIQFRSLDIEEL